MEVKKFSGYSWGIVLIVVGLLFLLGQIFPGLGAFVWGLVWAGAFGAMGLWFLTQYNSNKANWGLLIPAYVMFAIGGLIALAVLLPGGRLEGALIPAYVMFAIAAPFLYVYTRNTRNNWWALIPGGIMGVIGLAFATAALWQLLPAALIIAGIYILVRNTGLGRSKSAVPAAQNGKPKEVEFEPLKMGGPIEGGPEADK